MKEVPYKDMVTKNETLHEFPAVELGNDYYLKVRIKAFTLLDKKGNEYKNGPCISLQLFHNGHFLKAISIPSGREIDLLNRTNEAVAWINNNKMPVGKEAT